MKNKLKIAGIVIFCLSIIMLLYNTDEKRIALFGQSTMVEILQEPNYQDKHNIHFKFQDKIYSKQLPKTVTSDLKQSQNVKVYKDSNNDKFIFEAENKNWETFSSIITMSIGLFFWVTSKNRY
ncbi:hypothetical protein [Myroides sp. LoEW2-1]|uniref:hypothetical protein n=1 Tax=Myroides sp. LoEW2-1 TaxID=2683192 RepID=UPI00132C7360|nr:hypothetical protein [Myroides sp. LoEW2-1]MVX37198.1 hypothetical protein [Myroides sp. LoEW2-1]